MDESDVEILHVVSPNCDGKGYDEYRYPKAGEYLSNKLASDKSTEEFLHGSINARIYHLLKIEIRCYCVLTKCVLINLARVLFLLKTQMCSNKMFSFMVIICLRVCLSLQKI